MTGGRLTRRMVLRGAAALPLARLPLPARAEGYAAQVSLLLDGIGPGLAPDLLDRLVAPFLAAGLPVTCVADLVALTAQETADPALCDRLARLAIDNPGLFDLALPIGKLPRTERYFQIRRAGELRDAVLRAFRDGPAAARSFPVVTLVDRGEDPNIDHTAFRGAGFRIHLKAGDGPWQASVAGRGELVGTGGLWTPLNTPGLEERIRAGLSSGRDMLLALALPRDPAQAADLAARADAIALVLQGAMAAGLALMASPAQVRLYAGPGMPLDVAIVVDPGLGLEEREATHDFVRDLAGRGVPLTLVARAESLADLPGTVAFCPREGLDGTLPLPLPACLQSGIAASAAPGMAVATHLDAHPAIWPGQGIDPDGRLHLAPRDLAGAGAAAVLEMSPLEDHVILLTARDLMQPVQRALLSDRFTEAAVSAQAYFHTLPGLAAHLVETEPVLARLWSIRRRAVTDPARAPAPDPAERSRLMQDASLAWRYVQRFTDATTGLCAGTVQRGEVSIVNREATLWDLASQLHAIRVADQLALIDRDEARDRTRRVAENLPVAEVEGLRLPPAMFRTDDLGVVSPGFDICDAGRFLIALRASAEAGLLDRAAADGVVDGWDLAGALPGGRPHSHLAGRWIDTTLSHCTPYLRRGLAHWGFALVSPYPGLAGGSAADRRIARLYDIAAIGQVGVEPVLLEAIELGPDPGTDLIADVLFAAQLDWFDTTGRWKCASEAPLNFAPWFSYQGLRFGDLGPAAWVVRGLGGAAEHDTPAFRTRAELVSTKSAYLWSALRAHPWCDGLLQIIRDQTRIDDLGFSVGIFAETMEAMPGYTDLNTNGVVLTAIGHVLR